MGSEAGPAAQLRCRAFASLTLTDAENLVLFSDLPNETWGRSNLK